MTSESSGLIYAFVLEPKGWRALDWAGVRRYRPEQGKLWIHLDYACEDSQKWLAEESGLDPLTREALLAESPRPRVLTRDDALFLVVRGVNMNAGAQPEDMISLRIVADANRLVSLRHRPIHAVKSVAGLLERGPGPRSVGEMVLTLVDEILDRIALIVDSVDDTEAHLEQDLADIPSQALRHQLGEVRREAIGLRRYLAPQRDVLTRLPSEPVSWLSALERTRLAEQADRLTRVLEDLDAARERATVTQEELSNRLTELINRRLFVLSIVTAVFLPLSLITGVLGVNLGGIPGTDYPYGFTILVLVLLALIGGQLYVFRKLGWF